MAVRDWFDRAANYFSTDDIEEMDQIYEGDGPQSSQVEQYNETRGQTMANQTRTQAQQEPRPTTRQQASSTQTRYSEPVVSGNLAARRQAQQNQGNGRATIALKYPKKYNDAEEIVDLLIENECVLIDFQHMMDAQARRCLDFIDGASRVLAGNLKKVGASMYLLTPVDVFVDIEEMTKVTANQNHDFDFDLKDR